MSDESLIPEETKVDIILEAVEVESSEEPPMEEWSSYILELPQTNKKILLAEEGLYNPGSGEICLKYIAESASSVYRHPYFSYPAVEDPGIVKALLSPEEKVVYTDDGQDYYLALCKEMNECPVTLFYNGLLRDEIDLRYYCVNPAGVRPMCLALTLNRFVKVLNLTDNFLSDDACYHLGEMLTRNSCLEELYLSGCRIGPTGAKRLFAGLPTNRALRVLNLNKNQLSDKGLEYFAQIILYKIDVQKIYLSYNNIGGKGAAFLADSLETYNKLTHVDLSWNNLYTPLGTYNLLTRFGENKVLQELNLSWNTLAGPRLSAAIKNAMLAPNLKYLNLSNNRLTGEAITNVISNLAKAPKLHTLDLSFNPITPVEAHKILLKVKLPNCKVQKVLMENVFVDEDFLVLLKTIKEIKSKKKLVVTYGGVNKGRTFLGPDPRELILNRAEYLGKKPKKQPVDVALVFMKLLKDNDAIMPLKDFIDTMKYSGAPLDNDLLEEIANIFPGPKRGKLKSVDVGSLVEYIKRKWPERELPPTPPPEPEPIPVPEPQKGKGKGKK